MSNPEFLRDDPPKNGNPPSPEDMLQDAIAGRDSARIREIFEAHPDLDPGMPAIMKIFLLAIRVCDLDLARRMLGKGANVNDQDNASRLTPMMRALWLPAKAGPLVDLLLEYRADADATDMDGETALHIAMTREGMPPAVIRKLFAAQSDLFRVDEFGYTAFHTGACWRNIAGMKTLLDLAYAKTSRDPLDFPNPVSGMTPIQELQAIKDGRLSEEGQAGKRRMLQFFADYARQRTLKKVVAAASGTTQRSLPALPKLGRKP